MNSWSVWMEASFRGDRSDWRCRSPLSSSMVFPGWIWHVSRSLVFLLRILLTLWRWHLITSIQGDRSGGRCGRGPAPSELHLRAGSRGRFKPRRKRKLAQLVTRASPASCGLPRGLASSEWVFIWRFFDFRLVFWCFRGKFWRSPLEVTEFVNSWDDDDDANFYRLNCVRVETPIISLWRGLWRIFTWAGDGDLTD